MKNTARNIDLSFNEDSFFDGVDIPFQDKNYKDSVSSYPRNEQGFN